MPKSATFRPLSPSEPRPRGDASCSVNGEAVIHFFPAFSSDRHRIVVFESAMRLYRRKITRLAGAVLVRADWSSYFRTIFTLHTHGSHTKPIGQYEDDREGELLALKPYEAVKRQNGVRPMSQGHRGLMLSCGREVVPVSCPPMPHTSLLSKPSAFILISLSKARSARSRTPVASSLR